MGTALQFKDTFWNKVRVTNNVLYRELEEMIDGVSLPSIAMWFSGQTMPTKKQARQICDLFGVDYARGYEEFVKAHKTWVAERYRSGLKRSGKQSWWNEAMANAGLTSAEVAEKLGVNKTTVNSWTAGKNVPTDHNLTKLCELLGIDYDTGKRHFTDDLTGDNTTDTNIVSLPVQADTEKRAAPADEPKQPKHTAETAKTAQTARPQPIKKSESGEFDIFRLAFTLFEYDDFKHFCDLVAANDTETALMMMYDAKPSYEEFRESEKVLFGT